MSSPRRRKNRPRTRTRPRIHFVPASSRETACGVDLRKVEEERLRMTPFEVDCGACKVWLGKNPQGSEE